MSSTLWNFCKVRGRVPCEFCKMKFAKKSVCKGLQKIKTIALNKKNCYNRKNEKRVFQNS